MTFESQTSYILNWNTAMMKQEEPDVKDELGIDHTPNRNFVGKKQEKPHVENELPVDPTPNWNSVVVKQEEPDLKTEIEIDHIPKCNTVQIKQEEPILTTESIKLETELEIDENSGDDRDTGLPPATNLIDIKMNYIQGGDDAEDVLSPSEDKDRVFSLSGDEDDDGHASSDVEGREFVPSDDENLLNLTDIGLNEKNTMNTLDEKEKSLANIDFQTLAENPMKRKRIYDKLHSCLFCQKRMGKMNRHIQLCHKNEKEVIPFLALPENDETRIKGLHLLVREGDYRHNCNVLATKKGDLILGRRPNKLEAKNRNYDDFIPCPHCLGFFLKTSQRQHVKRCPGLSEAAQTGKISVDDTCSKSEALVGIMSPINIDGGFYKNVVNIMQRDDITDVKYGHASSDVKGSEFVSLGDANSLGHTDTSLNEESTMNTFDEKKKSLANIDFRTLAENPMNRKRTYDELHSCLFCQKMTVKINRHIQLCHKNEKEVIPFLALPEKDETRIKGLLLLVREGDYHHNCNVLATKKGELILGRRPKKLEAKTRNYDDFIPCSHCLGFFLKTSQRQHMRRCPGLSEAAQTGKISAYGTRSKSEALLGIMSPVTIDGDFYENIVSGMKKDDVTDVCKDDSIILQLGAFLFAKFNGSQSEYIRKSMRLLARVFMEVKNINMDIENIIECLYPTNFDTLLTAVKSLCAVEQRIKNRQMSQKGSLVEKLCPILKKTASLYRGISLRQKNSGDDILKMFYKDESVKMKDFLDLMDSEWKAHLSSTALSNLEEIFNSGMLLPLTEDLVLFNEHLKTETERTLAVLENVVSLTEYRRLSELTLANIVLFNKKRTSEFAKMTVKNYTERPKWDKLTFSKIADSMSPLEKILGETMAVCQIWGKQGRPVPVILTNLMQKSVERIIELREQVGIHDVNPYLFAITGYDKPHLRGHDCLKLNLKKLPLKAPDLINATFLRKYVSTVMQVLNLTENEAGWLACYLGHDIRIHREFYRKHDNAIEATKVSRLLLAVESGVIKKFAGMKLDEIQLEDFTQLEGEIDLLEPTDSLPTEDDGNEATSSRTKGSKRKKQQLKRKYKRLSKSPGVTMDSKEPSKSNSIIGTKGSKRKQQQLKRKSKRLSKSPVVATD